MVWHEACTFKLAQELRCSCIYVNCITPSVAYNPTSPLTPTPLAVLLVNGNFFLSFLLLPNPPPSLLLPSPYNPLHSAFARTSDEDRVERRFTKKMRGQGGRGEEEEEIVR